MKEQKPISHFIAGLIISAMLIVFSLGIYFLDMMQNRAMAWISYLILIGGLILFINLYGKAKNYELGFGGLFGYGFKSTAIIALSMGLFSLLFFLAFPEFKEQILEMTRNAMEEQGKATDKQIEDMFSMMDKNFLLFYIGFPILGYVFFGVIGSLIGAAVTRKNPVNPLNQ